MNDDKGIVWEKKKDYKHASVQKIAKFSKTVIYLNEPACEFLCERRGSYGVCLGMSEKKSMIFIKPAIKQPANLDVFRVHMGAKQVRIYCKKFLDKFNFNIENKKSLVMSYEFDVDVICIALPRTSDAEK